ncbi:T-cell immunoglobulin and mucin domain-containing protein 2-like [Leptodactylus fuscus]
MCWGRGQCPLSGCSDDIIWTDGSRVTWRKSDKYQLMGDMEKGDVTLTINRATMEDTGTYCCRVEVPGLFNDLKMERNVNEENVTRSNFQPRRSHGGKDRRVTSDRAIKYRRAHQPHRHRCRGDDREKFYPHHKSDQSLPPDLRATAHLLLHHKEEQKGQSLSV